MMSDLTHRPALSSTQQARRPEQPRQLDLASAAAVIKSPPEPTSPHQEKDAARAITRTNSWKPTFPLQRRVSYDMEDQKRHMQMTSVSSVREEPGFTEKA